MRRTTHSEHADVYVAWIDRHGVVPSVKSPDRAERVVAASYRRLRDKELGAQLGKAEIPALARMTAARTKAKAANPKRRSFTPSSACVRLADFVEANGRLPLNRHSAERNLYTSLRNLRARAKRGHLSPETLKAASSIPGFLAVVRLPPVPELEKLEAWCETNGRLPRHTIINRATEAEELEQHLGRWLYRHIYRRHDPVETVETQMIRDRILALQNIYPQMSKVNFIQQAAAILQFIEKVGRLPDLVHEPDLYRMCFALQRRYTGAPNPGAAIRTLLEVTSELPTHLESQWDGRMSDIESFVRSHGRLPGRAAHDAVEKSLKRWLHTARLINDPVRAARLDAFLAAQAEQLAA